MVKYETQHAEIDAELILRDVLKRTRYSYVVRDELAIAIVKIVNREKKSKVKERPIRIRNRTGGYIIK